MNEPVDTIAGLRPMELHYFRVPRERWELMLTRLHQMGANAVSTVIPWTWHEFRDSVFDLTGATHSVRDVVNFLETCTEMNFRVILRTAPRVGAGLLGGGVPGWLTRKHPEILSLGPDSQPRHDPTCGGTFPSAEHPTYLKYVERWYWELARVLTTRQRPTGPIVALRIDQTGSNDSAPQADGIPAHWDYNPYVVEVQWPIWLRQQYDGIDALNAAWGSDYRSFSDAAFPDQTPAGEPSPSESDAIRFVAYAATHAADTYARMQREMGWSVPILTSPGELPTTATIGLTHAVQVDPELPQVGAAVRWAMDAPVRPDGYPQRRFWSVKKTLLGMEQGVKQIKGGALVTGLESHRVRLPRPANGCGLYRLLLDGRLLDAACRTRGDMLYLDYMAADEAGETDMLILLNDPAAPLTGYVRTYLASLLLGRAQALRRTRVMCRALAQVFAGAEPPAGDESLSAAEDFQATELSLKEARLAARRAAASLGRLERLADYIRGEAAEPSPAFIDLSAFSRQEMDRLIQVRDTCAQVVSTLTEAIEAVATWCGKDGELPGGDLTIQTYRLAWERAQATARQVESPLASLLCSLRADLVAGSLSPSVWPIHDWLTRILQSLTASLPEGAI